MVMKGSRDYPSSLSGRPPVIGIFESESVMANALTLILGVYISVEKLGRGQRQTDANSHYLAIYWPLPRTLHFCLFIILGS